MKESNEKYFKEIQEMHILLKYATEYLQINIRELKRLLKGDRRTKACVKESLGSSYNKFIEVVSKEIKKLKRLLKASKEYEERLARLGAKVEKEYYEKSKKEA